MTQTVKILPAMQETRGSIPGLGRSPGEEHGNAFQSSCLENPMDIGGWRATVRGLTESDMTEGLTHQPFISGTFPGWVGWS